MAVNNYKDLIVWQKSMSLAVKICQIVKLLPKEELFVLSDQMCRAVVSIPSNISEGQFFERIHTFSFHCEGFFG